MFEQLKTGDATSSKAKGTLSIGVDTLPTLPKDAGDRNRTSPFAFIGNRFEFRAVGSSQSIAGPLVALNTIVADSLDVLVSKIEAAIAGGKDLNAAVQEVISGVANDHAAVIFNGDGYSEEWHAEAEKRGLKNLRTTPDALPELLGDAVVEMFGKLGVLSKRELESRFEIYTEQYALAVQVEANTVLEMG